MSTESPIRTRAEKMASIQNKLVQVDEQLGQLNQIATRIAEHGSPTAVNLATQGAINDITTAINLQMHLHRALEHEGQDDEHCGYLAGQYLLLRHLGQWQRNLLVELQQLVATDDAEQMPDALH